MPVDKIQYNHYNRLRRQWQAKKEKGSPIFSDRPAVGKTVYFSSVSCLTEPLTAL